MEAKMKRPFVGLWALTLLALVFLAVPIHAQTSAVAARPIAPAGPFSYDITRETTLTGTVSSLVTKPTPGMIMGAHLLVATPTGTVDASLERFALLGKDALSIAPGQQVQVTGVMKTIKGQQ